MVDDQDCPSLADTPDVCLLLTCLSPADSTAVYLFLVDARVYPSSADASEVCSLLVCPCLINLPAVRLFLTSPLTVHPLLAGISGVCPFLTNLPVICSPLIVFVVVECVPRVFTNDAFREELLNNCSIETTKRFWQEEAEKVEGEASQSNIAPYITSKFGNFISNDYIRPIISKPYSSFSFREVMDNGKLLFVKLSQGKIGKINAGLMGMIVTGKIALAAFSRDDTPEHQRRDFYLYIDSYQTCLLYTSPSPRD